VDQSRKTADKYVKLSISSPQHHLCLYVFLSTTATFCKTPAVDPPGDEVISLCDRRGGNQSFDENPPRVMDCISSSSSSLVIRHMYLFAQRFCVAFDTRADEPEPAHRCAAVSRRQIDFSAFVSSKFSNISQTSYNVMM
jgi:hypothetical protein